MKFGAWVHEHDISLENQIDIAAQCGLKTLRSYSLDYSKRVSTIIKDHDISLLAGMHVDAEALAADWRSQVHIAELTEILELDIPLEGICVGNELRQGGDDPKTKRFSACLSFGLTNLIDTYRLWMDDNGFQIPLTYAMEGIVFDKLGYFNEWIWPLIHVLDIVSVNLYPMGLLEWHGWEAFERNRDFLTDQRDRNDRLSLFELRLRNLLDQVQTVGKSMILTETGFPSAIGYHIKNETLVIPENDNDLYFSAMKIFLDCIKSADYDYNGRIKALYFYEWRDNLYHSKIWNVEESPIHVAFGLCDHFGKPKFDIQDLIKEDFS
jgi:hypothetical protein